MSNNSCVVVGCHNTYTNTKNLVDKVRFHVFPGRKWEEERRETWINFVHRQDKDGNKWTPTKNSLVCSQHFVGNKKSDDRLSPSFNPSILYPTKTTTKELNKNSSKLERYNRLLNRHKKSHLRVPVQTCTQDETSLMEMIEEPPQINNVSTQTEGGDMLGHLESFNVFLSSSVNNEASCQVTHPSQKMTHTVAVGPDGRSSVFCGFESLRDDAERLKSLTSVTLEVFSLLLSLLPHTVPLENELSWENRLLLFLMKLRLNLTFVALSTIFGVAPSTASNIFYSVLSYTKSRTVNWIFWPSRGAIERTMPLSFKKHYPKCRIIIDYTEIKTEMPPSVETRNNMYSNYKGTYTAKILLGIAPLGQITFVSEAYGGRSSDEYITNDCGILNKFESNDLIMADKRFPDIQIPNCTLCVIPPFAERGQNQFTESQIQTNTDDIPSVRIHVERAIQRIKIFNILTNRLTIDLLPHINEIIHVCAILVNLQPLIPDH